MWRDQVSNPGSLGLESDWGWSGDAMVLGKLPVQRRSTYLDHSRARSYCACSRCGWGCLDIFFTSLSILPDIDLNTVSKGR